MDIEEVAAEELRIVLLEIDQLRSTLAEYDDGDRSKRPHILHNLANALDKLFQITDDETTKSEALDLRRTAINLALPADPLLVLYKYELACSLSDLFDDTGLVEHLRAAVSLLREVVDFPPTATDGLPTSYDLLLQYALKAQVLFGVAHQQEDIDASIAAFIRYTAAIPEDHRTRKLPRCYWMTASAKLERQRYFPSSDILDEAFSLLERSSKVPGATSFDVLTASIIWAANASIYNHPSELEAYKQAFEHYAQFIWFGYGLRIRYSRLKSSDARLKLPVSAAECAIRFGQFERAVEWLDEGRSMLWGQMSKLRSSVERLRRTYPDLAKRLESAGQALEELADDEDVDSVLPRLQARPGTTQPYSRLDASDISEQKARCIAEWNAILKEVHLTPGFKSFLQPKPYSELKEISRHGPVFIINLVDNHCDALILRSPEEPIVHLTLSDMTEGRALSLKKRLLDALRLSGRGGTRSLAYFGRGRKDASSILRTILTELWRSVVEPILQGAGLNAIRRNVENDILPRVWWCPTGALIDLPLHAAGEYNSNGSSSVSVSDYVVSSYAPRLSTLLPVDNEEYSFVLHSPKTLAIGQAQAQGAAPLPGTVQELGILRQICGSNITSLEGEEANVAGVLAELRSTELAHFACHGEQSKLEFDSGLILYDGRLQISELIRQRVPNGRLAFLSACETAKGGLDTPDEVMNIASAMLFAGFKGVVGTLWSITDTDGPMVAEAFYTYLFQASRSEVDTRDAAVALHFAVKRLRDRGAPLVQWVPFIHLGV